MEKIITLWQLTAKAKDTLESCLDYISENAIYSPWTRKKAGWQELWKQSTYSGLYATCNALSLLAHYKERYAPIIDTAADELLYFFDKTIDYSDDENDSNEERTRKNRCRYLLEQNCHTTLKAVYFLRTIELLKSYDCLFDKEAKLQAIVESVYEQIEDAYDLETGMFFPAARNRTDSSMLTTMQAFILMYNKWGNDSKKTQAAKQMFINHLKDYEIFVVESEKKPLNKFDAYSAKKNFITSIVALSHAKNCLSSRDKDTIASSFFASMKDNDIRNGFLIRDSFTVPDTVIARDNYIADARLLYLKSVIQLIQASILPRTIIEFFIDDFTEIIDSAAEKQQYLSWDSSPSFSHNIRGLRVLHDLSTLFVAHEGNQYLLYITPGLHCSDYRTIEPLSVALFMSFTTEYSKSIQNTVRDVLDYIGFDTWWASNDPYGVFIVDSIVDKLMKAQFVIIDCNTRSPNVMYEAGLAHGLGKPTLLCGQDQSVFPYEDGSFFDTCIYDPNGEQNPPPYRDLQAGVLHYVQENIDSFCLTHKQKEEVLCLSDEFLKKYCK